MTVTLKGRLEFISLFVPVKLFTDNGEIDLRDYFWKLFENLNGKETVLNAIMNSIEIKADKSSTRVIQ